MPKIRKPIAQRFWEKVDIGGEQDCWNWKATTVNGYGRIYDNDLDKVVASHRMSWKLKYGEYPEKDVLHKCDNPSCVNPIHLFLGTQQDNMDDMISKGRHRYPLGTKVHTNKLSEADVLEIRRLSTQLNYSAVVEIFKVSKSAIKHIVKGRSWSWL